jgi:trehalose/maltose transport system substrate-binding protein
MAMVPVVTLAVWGSPRVLASSHLGSSSQASSCFKKSTATPIPPPAVQGASAYKKYKGQTITFYGNSVGAGETQDQTLACEFSKETGIKVKVVPAPQSTTDRYAATQRFFTGQSSAIDVTMVDVIYPSAFAPYLVDLKKPLADIAKLDYPSIVKNDTINGHLVAIPYFGDFGILWYRKDLLKKYGYSAPPTTWTQLTAMAKKIQAGEQKKNKNFHGFVFQGNSYEGLTCDALEWINSYGGGTIITHNGTVTLNNPKTIAALTLAQKWIGTIAPRGVTSYEEEDARNAFQAGDAAFMRNWPYVYSLMQAKGSAVANKFGYAPLPHGPGGKSTAAVGGWQLAVSKYSKHIPASIAFVRYMAGQPVEAWHAEVASLVPAMPGVGSIPAVKKLEPFLAAVGPKEYHAVRPSAPLGTKYNQGSTIFFQGVNRILNGSSVSSEVSAMTSQLKVLAAQSH